MAEVAKQHLLVGFKDYEIKQKAEVGELTVTILFESFGSNHFLADKYAEALRRIAQVVTELNGEDAPGMMLFKTIENQPQQLSVDINKLGLGAEMAIARLIREQGEAQKGE
ncbi:hypothetical protein [Paenibacillus daejeonensis]|uniref:hypothetical protein n=1 Tax=Paenibacillus daejeonensis TaxID=135193 RepID=UPI000374041F|nr:hypothetical protein [Paenibacillus daejeonensis]